MTRLRAYECSVIGSPHATVVNALSAGKARYDFLLDVRDCFAELTFADIRVRSLGAARTSKAFLRTAAYRGMPDIRCGDEVLVNGRRGLVAGHNNSANFDVTFIEGDWKGCTLNCHPNDIQRAPGARP